MKDEVSLPERIEEILEGTETGNQEHKLNDQINAMHERHAWHLHEERATNIIIRELHENGIECQGLDNYIAVREGLVRPLMARWELSVEDHEYAKNVWNQWHKRMLRLVQCTSDCTYLYWPSISVI